MIRGQRGTAGSIGDGAGSDVGDPLGQGSGVEPTATTVADTVTTVTTATAEPDGARRWGLLTVLLVGQFMANVDTAIVNTAAPSVHAHLGASDAEVSLVVSGYVIAYAVLLITGARLGAVHGHRTVFGWGLAVFTGASLACGLAPDPRFLIAARVVQGVGAALMVPQVLTGIHVYFSGRWRTRALGYYAVALSAGAVAGQALGGVVIAADLFGSGWRPIFLINVPVGLLLMAATVRFLPAKDTTAETPLDPAGVVLLAGAVLLVIVPLVLGPERGWPAWAWLCLAASGPVLAAFWFSQRRLARRGGRPLVAPVVVRTPAVRWALIAHGATAVTYFALLFVLASYLQRGLGHGPAYSGMVMVPWVIAFGLAGLLLPRIRRRQQPHAPITGCLILAATYLALWGYLATGHRSGLMLMVLLAPGGVGLGVAANALIGFMTAALPRDFASDLSGVISTNMQLCGAFGVAALGGAYLAMSDGGVEAPQAFGVFLLVCAAIALAAAAAAHRATRTVGTTG